MESTEAKAQLKLFLAKIDLDDTGVLSAREFIQLSESFGIQFTAGTKSSLETEVGDVNYRLYVDRLLMDEAGKWRMPGVPRAPAEHMRSH
jgi:hypothetical protein